MIQPIGPAREDHRAGVIAAAVMQAGTKRKDGEPWQPAHFFPDLGVDTRRQVQTNDQMYAVLMGALGGAVKES